MRWSPTVEKIGVSPALQNTSAAMNSLCQESSQGCPSPQANQAEGMAGTNSPSTQDSLVHTWWAESSSVSPWLTCLEVRLAQGFWAVSCGLLSIQTCTSSHPAHPPTLCWSPWKPQSQLWNRGWWPLTSNSSLASNSPQGHKIQKGTTLQEGKSMRNPSCTEGNTRRVPGLAQLIKSYEVTAASSMSILLQGRRAFPTAAFPFALGGTATLLQQGFHHYCKPRPVSGGLGWNHWPHFQRVVNNLGLFSLCLTYELFLIRETSGFDAAQKWI